MSCVSLTTSCLSLLMSRVSCRMSCRSPRMSPVSWRTSPRSCRRSCTSSRTAWALAGSAESPATAAIAHAALTVQLVSLFIVLLLSSRLRYESEPLAELLPGRRGRIFGRLHAKSAAEAARPGKALTGGPFEPILRPTGGPHEAAHLPQDRQHGADRGRARGNPRGPSRPRRRADHAHPPPPLARLHPRGRRGATATYRRV